MLFGWLSDFGIIAAAVSATNFFNVAFAFLFVLLALLLLLHRLVWPLLTRTLFRMADIGTTGRRAFFAAMVGIAVHLPLAFTDIYTGTESRQGLALLLSSCKSLIDETDTPDFEAFRSGMVFGLVTRAFLMGLVARMVSSWRASRETPASHP